MSETAISTSLESARRLAVTKQHLAGKLPTGSASEAILSVIRDLGKRCLCGPLPPANARRGHGRGPPRKPENLGPAGNVPPKLGGEEGADRTRGRAGGCGEDDPSPWYRVPFRDQRLFSARSVSEPEEGPGTFAEGIGNPSGSNHGARGQGRTICP